MKIEERMNVYVCEYGCHNVTVDVAKGVTPFMIKCERTADKDRPLDPKKSKDGVCVGTANSCMYPQSLPHGAPYPVPKHEWYRPDLEEFMGLSDPEKDHVKQGGLLLRKRTDAKPLFHKDEWRYEDEDFKKEIEIFNKL